MPHLCCCFCHRATQCCHAFAPIVARHQALPVASQQAHPVASKGEFNSASCHFGNFSYLENFPLSHLWYRLLSVLATPWNAFPPFSRDWVTLQRSRGNIDATLPNAFAQRCHASAAIVACHWALSVASQQAYPVGNLTSSPSTQSMISPSTLAAQQHALHCSPPLPNMHCPSIAMLATHCKALTLPLLPKNLPSRKERLPLHHCTGKVLQGAHPPFGGGGETLQPSIVLATCFKALLPQKLYTTINTNTKPCTPTH